MCHQSVEIHVVFENVGEMTSVIHEVFGNLGEMTSVIHAVSENVGDIPAATVHILKM